jgi:hypothetical protein
MNIVTGDPLPNGATVLEVNGLVILAKAKGPQPYVTWRWDGQDPRSTTWGNYFTSIAEAAQDFESRVGREFNRIAGGVE